MYWYAVLNTQTDVCDRITSSGRSDLADIDPCYISIPFEDYSYVGKRYNRETQEWETLAYKYYAVLNEANVVLYTEQTTETITTTGYMEIPESLYYNVAAGMVYYAGTFMSMEEANYRMLLALTAQAAE